MYATNYLYQNVLRPKILSWKHRDILRANTALKNTQTGKRCFILGTGPSINQVDIKRLTNEWTFAVNDFDRHPNFADLNAKYYVMADTAYFNSTNDTDYFAENLRHKSQVIPAATRLFVNLHSKPMIEAKKLFAQNPISYLSMHGIFSDKIPFSLQIDQTIPTPKNVTLACLVIAVYLGFKEIYLLGCEHNYLSNNTGAGQIKTVAHFYPDSQYAKLDIKDPNVVAEYQLGRDLKMTYEGYIGSILQLFKNYRLFFEQVRRTHPEVEIYNATPNSYLDVFPKIDFKDISF